MNSFRKIMIFSGLPAAFLIAVESAAGQPVMEFVRNFGDGSSANFQDVYAVSDDGFIACGSVGGSVFVVRTDSTGRENWRYVSDDGGIANSVIETDGGDFVCGLGRNHQFSATKLSGEGEEIWKSDYAAGSCSGVIELKSGDFLLCGESNGNGHLVMINGDGERIWSRSYAGGNRARFEGVRQSDENSAVAAGTADDRVWAVKADLDDGDPVWSNQFWEGPLYVLAMTSTRDGMFAVTGFKRSSIFIVKFNSDGEEIWHREYERSLYHDNGAWTGRSIACSRDGGFVISGYWLLFRPSLDLPFCFRTNSLGQARWMSEFDFEGDENVRAHGRFRGVVFNDSDEIIAAGFATNREQGNSDAIIVKLLSDIPEQRDIVISPEDTVFSTLVDSSVVFSVTLEGNWRNFLTFDWIYNDSLIGDDSAQTVTFEEIGESLVECRIHFDQITISIRWHVTVSDFFIASHSPDTLNLTLRRGSSVDFSIDSIAAVEGEDPILYQWTLIPANEQGEVVSTDSIVFIDFLRSGNYSLEGMAYRGESHDEVVWDVEVRGAIWSFLPEDLQIERLEGENVEFQIIPTLSDSLNWYTWLYDGGMIREGWDSVFVMNLFELGEHTITGILADSVESDTVEWVVRVLSDFIGQGGQDARPTEFGIESVSPNPFNAVLTIRFQSSPINREATRLGIYDLSGREVARLFDSHTLPPSRPHTLTWNAESLPGGIYLIRLEAGGQSETVKVVLLR